ncbi:MAG: haloalkane dehalogenase [Methylococcaceae bacterium TMED69]|nr:MAG: haloalkane dehalogenase [Methylococcaceae bacterium TMED69]
MSSNWRSLKKSVNVSGLKISYVEMGVGRPIIFQHGNPTSSFLWRKIMPKISQLGRCIAIDLVGMGDSDKISDINNSSYTFNNHKNYWRKALQALGVEKNIIFVLHDWGSALGFDYFADSPDTVDGICHMEAIYDRMDWADWPESSRKIFQGLRGGRGEEMILKKNIFVERILPASILRRLTNEEMDEYRRPFTDEGMARLPTLAWPRQLPIANVPSDVCAVVKRYNAVLRENDVSKLFINADPGVIVTSRIKEIVRSWTNQKEVTVKGLHFIQEDSPDEISSALFDWMQGI